MIVNGFCKEVFSELPMEFAMEAQKLLGVSLRVVSVKSDRWPPFSNAFLIHYVQPIIVENNQPASRRRRPENPQGNRSGNSVG